MTRPRASRLGAWASTQSKTLESRAEFEKKLKEIEKSFESKEVTRPEFWGGWRVKPNTIEFWEAQEFRYHHRELFEKDNNGNWTSRLLYPSSEYQYNTAAVNAVGKINQFTSKVFWDK
jgi:pyridoxamine 5'-phosphate oxidase